MKIQVLFFARSRELAGTSSAVVDVDEGDAPTCSGSSVPAWKICEGHVLLSFTGATTQEAMQLIWEQYPALKEIQGDHCKPAVTSAQPLHLLTFSACAGRCVLALNQEYVDTAAPQPLKDNDEIAVIPPISGG